MSSGRKEVRRQKARENEDLVSFGRVRRSIQDLLGFAIVILIAIDISRLIKGRIVSEPIKIQQKWTSLGSLNI